MKVNLIIALIALAGISDNLEAQSQDYLQLSYEMLGELKEERQIDSQVDLLKSATMEELREQLDTDDKKYAFWINIYNAYILHILRADSTLYDDRRDFFKKKQFTIAGQEMSFADVEHGIIRRSQLQYFLGYIRNPFAPRYQRKLRPDDKEYRVHFALNCGAKSCPPIEILKADELEAQLNKLTETYLKKFTQYDSAKNEVTTTPLTSWFRGDFGGKGGTREILLGLGLIPTKKVDLKYGPYDWSLDLYNFAE